MQKSTNSYLTSFSLGLLSLLLPVLAYAQPESESPYSDQAYDPIDNPAWYETPFLYIGIVLMLAVFIYLFVKGRRA